jgi:acetyl-CoA synthetase
MTRGFWKEPDRYLDTYWRRFPGTWVHGDWASIDEDGFWFLHGRSDDTLNIAGKRIGPAEFESVAVALPEVVMAAAIGIPDPIKGEVVVMYVVPTVGSDRAALPAAVAAAVVSTLGKSFRPKTVVVVDDLPRTRSAKIMRRVVRSLALGADPGDLSALENPDSLEGIGRL